MSGFNTSHVVVYQNGQEENRTEIEQFQYISCCSLSYSHKLLCHTLRCFNTSHVVVYRWYTMEVGSDNKGFNTSHVVVYPNCASVPLVANMFQYISCCSLSPYKGEVYQGKQFQYISCCSLSPFSNLTMQSSSKFQYISCCSLSHISSLFCNMR